MDFNDYIQIGGSLNQVIQLEGKVRDIITKEEKTVVLSGCPIFITQDVLLACNFTKGENDNEYICTLHVNNKTCVIICTYLSIEKTYEMRLTGFKKSVIPVKEIEVLSDLQDWVRVNAGMELTVDENKLAEAVKKQLIK